MSSPNKTKPADAASPTQEADAPRMPRAASSWRAWVLFVSIVACVTASDLWVKAWAFETVAGVPVVLTRENAVNAIKLGVIPPHRPVVVVPHVLNLTLTTNAGAVFGLGKGRQTFFVIVSLLATGAIVVLFARSGRGEWIYQICLALILGGAWGNLYDRAVFNAVRDMLWMLPDTKLWPWIFNVADAALVIGVSVLVLLLWRGERKISGEQPPQNAEKARS